MIDLRQIIKKCKAYDKKAQKELYDIYSPVLYGICLRYGKSEAEAEDILQDAFIKILTKINDFDDRGSFEGWMKKIVVNTAITAYHKNKKHNELYDITEIKESDTESYSFGEEAFTKEELMNVINSLPEGYRVIFNLYAIEGYKHKEIAEMLNISHNTSKSQYLRAKEKIRAKLEAISKIKIQNVTK
ncbi:MAG: RNA polymerase sigma factor [Chlorobi bacterium]|nr:RNA polymerase sigma factor [Chlorobiota bacterium]